MAIIQYNSSIGEVAHSEPPPSGISDGGYFFDEDTNIAIGIGTGVGTELTKAELITYVVSVRNVRWPPIIERPATNDEKTTMVNDWCTARGIS